MLFRRLFNIIRGFPKTHSLADAANVCNLTMPNGLEEKYGVLKAMIHRVNGRFTGEGKEEYLLR